MANGGFWSGLGDVLMDVGEVVADVFLEAPADWIDLILGDGNGGGAGGAAGPTTVRVEPWPPGAAPPFPAGTFGPNAAGLPYTVESFGNGVGPPAPGSLSLQRSTRARCPTWTVPGPGGASVTVRGPLRERKRMVGTGTFYVGKCRRMNPFNPRALRRADTRIEAFERRVKKTSAFRDMMARRGASARVAKARMLCGSCGVNPCSCKRS